MINIIILQHAASTRTSFYHPPSEYRLFGIIVYITIFSNDRNAIANSAPIVTFKWFRRGVIAQVLFRIIASRLESKPRLPHGFRHARLIARAAQRRKKGRTGGSSSSSSSMYIYVYIYIYICTYMFIIIIVVIGIVIVIIIIIIIMNMMIRCMRHNMFWTILRIQKIAFRRSGNGVQDVKEVKQRHSGGQNPSPPERFGFNIHRIWTSPTNTTNHT